jgi:hypothetical protein
VVAKRVKNEAGKRLSFEEGKIQKRPGRVVPLRSVLAKETSQLSRQLVFEFSSFFLPILVHCHVPKVTET